MSAKQTIIINGEVYDAISGLPLNTKKRPTTVKATTAAKPAVRKTTTETRRQSASTAKNMHRTSQKSTTLRRSHLKSPASKTTAAPTVRKRAVVEKSPMVTRFAAHPQPIPRNQGQPVISDMATLTIKHKGPKPAARPTSTQVKEKLISEASKKVSTTHKEHKAKRPSILKQPKLSHIVSACFALMLLGGYFTYTSMPGVSVSIAGQQAGIQARFPDYQPDGYSFEGPVTFQPGEVKLRFKSNSGGKGFVINQRASSWNSGAVLDNLVAKASKGRYETTSEGGVTIYTYQNKAAWTNGGILYTIDGEAPLAQEQILRIASSL